MDVRVVWFYGRNSSIHHYSLMGTVTKSAFKGWEGAGNQADGCGSHTKM